MDDDEVLLATSDDELPADETEAMSAEPDATVATTQERLGASDDMVIVEEDIPELVGDGAAAAASGSPLRNGGGQEGGAGASKGVEVNSWKPNWVDPTWS